MSDILLDSHAFLWFVWDDPLLSPAAKQQVVAYDAGRDGLVSNLPDREWRPKKKRRFTYIQGRPILGK